MSCVMHKLDPTVSTKLRAQQHITSVPSVVRELLHNSADAKATQIKIVVDFKKSMVYVQDNGNGIQPDNLETVGKLNYTSNITTLNDIKENDKYGFRGEALYHIASVSHVKVISKSKDYNSTWIKSLNDNTCGIYSGEGGGHFSIHDSGTIILIEDLFYNVPVRQTMLSKYSEPSLILQIKNDIFQVSIANPMIDIIVYDVTGSTEELTYKDTKSSYVLIDMKPSLCKNRKLNTSQIFFNSYMNIYDSSFSKSNIKQINIKFRDYVLEGIISRSGTSYKNRKFIYINGRRYINNVFLRSIDNIFQSVGFGSNNDDNVFLNSSKRKQYSKYPIIILNVKCKLELSDYIQDPTKQFINLSKKDIIEPLIYEAINTFLIRQGYTPSNVKTISDMSSEKLGDISPRKSNQSLSLAAPEYGDISLNIIFNSKVTTNKITKTELRGRYKVSQTMHKSTQHFINIRNILQKRNQIDSLQDSSYFSNINKKENKIHLASNKIEPGFNLQQYVTSLNQKFQLDKLHLDDLQVINQIDNKFILTILPDMNVRTNYSLIILDQHACDERIKLEQYLNEYIKGVINKDIDLEVTKNININISKNDASLCNYFKNEFECWGIIFEIDDAYPNSPLLKILKLPKDLITNKYCDLDYLRTALLAHTHDLQKSVKSKIRPKLSHNKFVDWYLYLNYVPDFVLDLFNTKACRSAIMFGDPLSKNECSVVVKLLSNCHFPFKCAHGRPSIFPLIQCKLDEESFNISLKTSLWNEDYKIT
ncbi:hypothetical protein TPHA_0D01330 [Tetrapisispora phaffii CBS 4417]|uniref:MutL C-terminal dimerisation domain-containing protein n=1 Tax=Tetrapisispora phaffii (strain ATCC 24235 / CBS 4417 / NBRC 1672 / NRRL Y-8282 / UCD 70-5) TaxID=1071381 RepID=G8BSF3_TETPH|nr:hypothetical protein TPHA_0D01330 [Tetrapisispora phaffii CBS 4417]CCE62774.1 hypothetical protein TPHA_0D01330 [Tetrapisispora phaffii CBS 4417]